MVVAELVLEFATLLFDLVLTRFDRWFGKSEETQPLFGESEETEEAAGQRDGRSQEDRIPSDSIGVVSAC